MTTDYRNQLATLSESELESSTNSKIRIGEDGISIVSQPGGMPGQLAFLLILVVPPIILLIKEPQISSYAVAAFWLLIMGRSFLSLLLSDTRAVFDPEKRTITVSNINPLVLWVRKALYSPEKTWHATYEWGSIRRLSVSYRVHTRMVQGYAIDAWTSAGKRLRIGEFERENIAWKIQATLSAMLGLPSGLVE